MKIQTPDPVCSVARPFASLLLLVLSGCQVMGAIAYKAAGPPEVPAKYILPKTPTVVLCETFNTSSGASSEADRLAQVISDELNAHKLTTVIEPHVLMNLRSKDPQAFSKMSIRQIGAACGAAQVLYVNVSGQTVQMAQGSEVFKGEATAKVKVVDVQSGASLWPEDASEGYPVSCNTPMIRPNQHADATMARIQLEDALGEEIVRMFYKWKPEM